MKLFTFGRGIESSRKSWNNCEGGSKSLRKAKKGRSSFKTASERRVGLERRRYYGRKERLCL
jgi:hypothetical protein